MRFEYDYFISRTRLAAIDHNYHLFRPYAFMKYGRMVHHRKFLKRTGTYSVCPVKVQKDIQLRGEADESNFNSSA